MKYENDLGVYIGRFQPPHKGHLATLKIALQESRKVFVLVGSAFASPDLNNPWSYEDRVEMITSCINDMFGNDSEELARVHFFPVEDFLYQNNRWLEEVQDIVDRNVERVCGWRDKNDWKISLYGYKKDSSSWYLEEFPQWKEREVDPQQFEPEFRQVLSSTDIRLLYFSGNKLPYLKNVVSPAIFDYLSRYTRTSHYKVMLEELSSAEEYERKFQIPKDWSMNFYTADAVVIQSGHILLIERAGPPGKGLWALPGGHVGKDETAEQAAIRELREETGLSVPEKVLRGSIKEAKLFDHPNRSLRARVPTKLGRTVTIAHHIVLEPGHKLPRVSGKSDAARAWWFPLSKFRSMRHMMFEDHFHIASYFINQPGINHPS